MNRFYHYSTLIAVIAFCIGLTACSDKDEPIEPSAQRAVLVYMAADCNLGNSYDLYDLNEMRQTINVGECTDGRVFVYHSRRGKDPVLVELKANRTDTLIKYPYGVPAASAERMRDVLQKTAEFAKTPSYGLVLWGHGTGWLDDGITYEEGISHSYGPERGYAMTIPTLATVLEGFGANEQLDYVYFDCCYMGSVETVYQLRHATPFIVASATELRVEGMPYDENLPLLIGGTRADLIAAATNTFELYNAQSFDNRTCTMSVIDTEALNELALAVGAIYAISDGSTPEGYQPQRFMDYIARKCYYFDLLDYAEALATEANAEPALIDALHTAFDKAVIYSAATPKLWNSVPLDRHNGLSTFIPQQASEFTTTFHYNRLEWYADVAIKLYE